jgi:hypothetical protein
MIPPQTIHVIRKGHEQRKQESHNFHRKLATIYVVAQK